MAYGVNVVENIDCLEVYHGEEFDQPRWDPHQIQEQLKNQMQHQLKHTLEEALEWERDQHVQAGTGPHLISSQVFQLEFQPDTKQQQQYAEIRYLFNLCIAAVPQSLEGKTSQQIPYHGGQSHPVNHVAESKGDKQEERLQFHDAPIYR